MPNWIGDAVMASPVLADIKAQFKDCKLTAMCQGAIGQLFTHDPHIDEIFQFTKPSGWVHHLTPSPIINNIRKGEFDTGILMTNSFSSAWWFYRGRVQNRIGFKGNLRSLLLNHALPFPKDIETQHLVKTYKELLLPLGIDYSTTEPKLYLSDEEVRVTKEVLRKEGAQQDSIVVGISPGAAYGSAKCWIPERFRLLAQSLVKDPKKFVIFFGDASQRNLSEKITQDLGERVLNLTGKTSLRELMAYMQECDVMVANDSGAMHMSYGLDIPVVALFGPTSDVKTGPLKRALTIHKHVPCSPCYKKVCPISDPNDHHKCMKDIEVEEVQQAIEKLCSQNSRK